MTALNKDQWFTEIHPAGGSAFSVQLGEKVHEEVTPFQTIAIYDSTDYGYVMAIDGIYMLTTRDNFLYHEMMSHPVLYTHPNPQNVVIIGGGDCGTLREVLKHPEVKSVKQIEIDERVTRVAEKYFPELCASNHDSRAELIFVDGIAWMKEARPNSIDVIIVDSTDPVGPAEGLFQKSFYESCLRALTPHGLLVQQSESPLYHLEKIIVPMHEAMLSAGFTSTHMIQFPQPCYPSGWWTASLASKNSYLTSFRQADARNKSFDTQYYNAEIHQGALALPELVKKALKR